MNCEDLTELYRLLKEISYHGYLYRKFMSKNEISLSNKMVRDGLLYKSKPTERNSTIAFFITGEGENFLSKNNIN